MQLTFKEDQHKITMLMNELDKTNGLDIEERYSTNVNKCYDFASAIADVQCNAIREHLGHSNFVSVIVDDSMDRSITANEMVNIQTCWAGLVHTNFIYSCQVQHGTSARIVEGIQRSVLKQ